MPQKTNKSVKKRFTVTPSGKVMFRRGPKNHFRAKKSGNKIRRIGDEKTIADASAKKITEHYLPHR